VIAAGLTAVAGDDAVVDETFGVVTIDVAADRWVEVATMVRDDPRTACDFFDWLSAYDDRDAGLAVAAHVWSLRHKIGVVLRTHVPRDAAQLTSLTSVWPGADWHERETFEMFGIEFDGHPNLVPLLLPDGFEGHPLRKEFVLASRVAKDWPGRKEPGESEQDVVASAADATRRRRRRMQPPGVPEPGAWGSEQ
jgi:NADH-quinone oxidoreductase subunit C